MYLILIKCSNSDAQHNQLLCYYTLFSYLKKKSKSKYFVDCIALFVSKDWPGMFSVLAFTSPHKTCCRCSAYAGQQYLLLGLVSAHELFDLLI